MEMSKRLAPAHFQDLLMTPLDRLVPGSHARLVAEAGACRASEENLRAAARDALTWLCEAFDTLYDPKQQDEGAKAIRRTLLSAIQRADGR